MLNIIYHKSFKETGKKECVNDETYKKMLDYIEWFDSPALNPVELLDPLPDPDLEIFIEDKEDEEQEEQEEQDDEIEGKKKRGRPKIKKE